MSNLLLRRAYRVLTATLLLLYAWPSRAQDSAPATDWPQWRGPHRDGIAPASPRLLDHWPKDGPPQLWKSDWIPACEEGGTGSPVVADGKVFVYANAKVPVAGTKPYQFITADLLAGAGWSTELPEDLAKKIEAAWSAKDRPESSDWAWWNPDIVKKPGELDAFLAKKPAVDKYIKDFLATLKPDEASKYGDYIKRRLSVDAPRNKWGVPNGLTWEQLTKLSALKDTAYPTRRQWRHALENMCDAWLIREAFLRSFTWADRIVCLDAATGKTLWTKDFPATAIKNPGVQWWAFGEDGQGDCVGIGGCATPAVWNGKVYATGSMGLYCLSAKDGTLLWQVKGPPEHASPLVAGGVVYNVGCAYDAETGKPLWKNQFWDGKHKPYEWTARYMSPLLFTSGGKNFVLTTDFKEESSSSYCCLEMETGKSLWNFKSPVGSITTIHDDILVAPPLYGASGAKAYKLSPTGAEVLWKKMVSGGAGHVYQDHIYMPGSVYTCVDLKTGEPTWKNAIPGGVSECSSTVLADGKIFTPLGEAHQLTKGFGDLTYSLSMIQATPEKYTELGVFNPKMCMMTAPAIANGRMYLRLLDGIACYDLQEHGAYLDSVAVKKDTLAFKFKQTGGALVAKELAAIQISEAGDSPKPAQARIDGETLLVDIKNAALPFSITAKSGVLAGKNDLPVPPFSWSDPRLLKFQKCFDNTIMLTSALPLQQDGRWSKPEAFDVAGAKIARIDLDPQGKSVSLITDKTWKSGDAIAVSYAAFPVEHGDVRREKLTATAAEPQRAAAKFVKLDETTSGTWKGVYGSEGAVVAGDAGVSATPKCALLTPANKTDGVPWAANAADPRMIQKTGDAKDRSVTSWTAPEQFDINVEITDGKEHQVALYCMGWNTQCSLLVEALDADTKAVLDSRPVTAFVQGKYLVWNIKGQVILRVSSTVQAEGVAALASGVFIDPAGK